MNTRVIVASIAGGAALFLVGFLVYGLLLDPLFMRPNMIEYSGLTKDPPAWIPLVLANIVEGFFLALIFDKWAGIKTWSAGASAGAIIMFLFAVMVQLFFLAFMNLAKNYTPALADIVGSTIHGAVGGAVIGLVLGFMSKDSATAAA